MSSLTPHNKVLIVGAGPAGMLSALMLSQKGISVDILEASDSIGHRSRGIAYGPAAIQIFQRAGVLADIRKAGTSFKNISWRRHGGEVLAGREVDGSMVALPVGDLSELLLKKLPATCKGHWNHKIVDVGSDDQEVWVDVDLANGQRERMVADFIIGADGAQSALVALNVCIDLSKYDMPDAQWTIEEEQWNLICRIDKQENFWRAVYGQEPGLTEEELRTRMPEKLKAVLPGNPEPEEYKVVRFSPYMIPNRCAEHLAVGRVLLAGDTAHLCNPMGGLGLTGGVADVGALVNCLDGIYHSKASLQILQKYDEVRCRIYEEVVDRTSTTNLQRMTKNADIVAAEDPFAKGLREHDEGFLRQMGSAELSLIHDMTQNYDL